MSIKTSELDGTLLNSFVAKCEGLPVHPGRGRYIVAAPLSRRYADEFDFLAWKDGGPIIERERIELQNHAASDGWWAGIRQSPEQNKAGGTTCTGPTPLIAAMRAYVASKLGDEVELDQKGAA